MSEVPLRPDFLTENADSQGLRTTLLGALYLHSEGHRGRAPLEQMLC